MRPNRIQWYAKIIIDDLFLAKDSLSAVPKLPTISRGYLSGTCTENRALSLLQLCALFFLVCGYLPKQRIKKKRRGFFCTISQKFTKQQCMFFFETLLSYFRERPQPSGLYQVQLLSRQSALIVLGKPLYFKDYINYFKRTPYERFLTMKHMRLFFTVEHRNITSSCVQLDLLRLLQITGNEI